MQRRHTVILVVVLGLCFGVYGWLRSKGADWAIRNAHPGRGPVIVIGDSLGTPWSAVLSGGFGQDVVDMTSPQETTQSAAERLPEYLKVEPRLSVLILGANDLVTGGNAESIYKNLSRLIPGLQAAGSLVALGTIFPAWIGDNWKLLIEGLCQEHGVIWLGDVLQGGWGDRRELPNSDLILSSVKTLSPRVQSQLSGYYP